MTCTWPRARCRFTPCKRRATFGWTDQLGRARVQPLHRGQTTVSAFIQKEKRGIRRPSTIHAKAKVAGGLARAVHISGRARPMMQGRLTL